MKHILSVLVIIGLTLGIGYTGTAWEPKEEEQRVLKAAASRSFLQYRPAVRVRTVQTAPYIDGIIDPLYLDNCKPLSFRFLDSSPGIPDEKTTGYLCADKEALYIVVRCEKKEPERTVAERKERDNRVWIDEVVEIFLDPQNSGKDTYFHIIVNSAGVTQDSRNKSDKSWNPDLTIACSKEPGKAWLMEMKIPFKELGLTPDNLQKTWSLNICRASLDPDDPETVEETAWSPTGSNSFHIPGRFGMMWLDSGKQNNISGTVQKSLTEPGPEKRLVWVWSDSKFGVRMGGKDGSEWARLSHTELKKNIGNPDYAVVLGDMTDKASRSELEDLARFRTETGIPNWFEIAGNHEYPAVENGLYQELIRPERRYVVRDGNLVWILISAQQRATPGILTAPTRRWLLETLKRHQDKNIIVCTHQIPPDTIRTSDKRDFSLSPKKWIKGLFKEVRVDAWLCGHDPDFPRSLDQMKTITWPKQNGKIRHTTFINASSLHHASRTRACNSVVLELKAGKKTIRARVRDHDKERFLPGHEILIPLAHSLELGAKPTVIEELPYGIIPKKNVDSGHSK
jgi:hypothetical protein